MVFPQGKGLQLPRVRKPKGLGIGFRRRRPARAAFPREHCRPAPHPGNSRISTTPPLLHRPRDDSAAVSGMRRSSPARRRTPGSNSHPRKIRRGTSICGSRERKLSPASSQGNDPSDQVMFARARGEGGRDAGSQQSSRERKHSLFALLSASAQTIDFWKAATLKQHTKEQTFLLTIAPGRAGRERQGEYS